MKTSLISLLKIALAAAAASVLAQSAWAHAHPKQQTPGVGATVGADQKQVSIEFDDALEPAFSVLQVADAHGKSVTSGRSSVDAGDKKHMTVALQALKPGDYTVAWVAVAEDGHRTQGHYRFTVK